MSSMTDTASTRVPTELPLHSTNVASEVSKRPSRRKSVDSSLSIDLGLNLSRYTRDNCQLSHFSAQPGRIFTAFQEVHKTCEQKQIKEDVSAWQVNAWQSVHGSQRCQTHDRP